MLKQFFKFLTYLKPLKWKFALALLSGMVAAGLSGFGLPLMIEKVFPVIFDNKPFPGFLDELLKNNVSPEYLATVTLIVACMATPVIFALRGLATFINGYLMSFVGMSILEEIRVKAFERLQIVPLAFHERQQRGDIISRLISDAQNVQNAITQEANSLIKQPITLISALFYLIYRAIKNDQLGTLYNLGFIALCAFPIYIFGKRIMTKAMRAQERMGDLNSVAQENLASQREVRSYSMQEQQIGLFHAIAQQFRKAQLKTVKYRQLLMPVIEIFTAFGLAVLLVQGYYDGLTLEQFTAMATALYMCYDPLKRVGNSYNRLKQSQASLERLSYILDEPDTMPDPKIPAPVNHLTGHVSYGGVSFSYDGKHKALNGISVEIPAGQVVALVGPSGAGKTTFASMLPRFYDVTGGQINVDGIDIRNMTKHQLRSNMALVSQSVALFRNTIMENIRVGRPEATDEEVIEASKKASVHEFVSDMPEGYQTMLGDAGSGLSGGQRQRVAIARAFLKNAPILILDEATASLDAESEVKIQQELDILSKGRTTLIVAHRFSSIRSADRILVFEGGHIIGDGSHQELYRNCPLYKELYDKQAF